VSKRRLAVAAFTGSAVIVLAIPQLGLSSPTTQQDDLARTWVERAIRVIGGEDIRTSAHGYQNHSGLYRPSCTHMTCPACSTLAQCKYTDRYAYGSNAS
jgi:hypothetical protein